MTKQSYDVVPEPELLKGINSAFVSAFDTGAGLRSPASASHVADEAPTSSNS